MQLFSLVLSSIVLFSVIGIHESFAQIYDLSDYPGEWYLGEGLKEGDYFEYSLCEIDLNDCAPIKLKMWIKGEIPYESETLWDARVVIYDGDKIIKGSWGLGKIVSEPITFDDDLFDYAIAFKSSLAWLGAYATSVEGDRWNGPQEFSAITPWGGKICDPGCPQVIPRDSETITIPAGTFDTIIVGWYSGEYNKIWIVDDFPFPVKALTYAWVITDIAPIMYQFTLLDYRENVMDDPFKDVVESITKEKLLGCITKFSDYVSGRVSPNTHTMTIQYNYSPEFPMEGCDIDWKINFMNKYNDVEFVNQLHYDIWVVDENGNKLRSYANDLGRDELFNGFGQIHILLPVEEEAGLVRYTIFIHGTGPEYEIPDPTLGGYATIEIEIKENPLMHESFVQETELIENPKQQLRNGVFPEDIICKEGKELIFKPNNSPACVKPSTAEILVKRGWTEGISNIDSSFGQTSDNIPELVSDIPDNLTAQYSISSPTNDIVRESKLVNVDTTIFDFDKIRVTLFDESVILTNTVYEEYEDGKIHWGGENKNGYFSTFIIDNGTVFGSIVTGYSHYQISFSETSDVHVLEDHDVSKLSYLDD